MNRELLLKKYNINMADKQTNRKGSEGLNKTCRLGYLLLFRSDALCTLTLCLPPQGVKVCLDSMIAALLNQIQI